MYLGISRLVEPIRLLLLLRRLTLIDRRGHTVVGAKDELSVSEYANRQY